MNTVTYIKDLEDWNSSARLYRVDPPMRYRKWSDDGSYKIDVFETEYVAVSAIVAMYSGTETYIFAANANGEVLDWEELDGSYRGGLNHERALLNAGYAVQP